MLCVTWWGEDEKGFLKFSQKYFSIVSLPPSPTFFSIFLPTFPKRCWIWSWKNIDSFFILSLIPSLSTHTNFPLPVHDWKRYNSAPDVWAEILLCETLKRALSWGSLALCWKTNLLLSADSGLCSLWVFVEWQWVNNCGHGHVPPVAAVFTWWWGCAGFATTLFPGSLQRNTRQMSKLKDGLKQALEHSKVQRDNFS